MKKIYFLSLLFVVTLSASAQIRHVKGLKGFGAYGGVAKYGYVVGGDFMFYLNNKSYTRLAVFNDKSEDLGSVITSTGVDLMYSRTMKDYKGLAYFNLVLGSTVVVDGLKSSEYYESYNKFKYGFLIGVESEIYLSDKFTLIPAWNTRYLLKDDLGQQRYYTTLGIRYNF